MLMNGVLYAIEEKFISVPVGIDSLYMITMSLIIIVVSARIYVKMIQDYRAETSREILISKVD